MNGLTAEEQESIAAARAKALQTAQLAFEKLDLDGNGMIDRQEAQKLAASDELSGSIGGGNQPVQDKEAKIQEFFDTFDEDKSGTIEKEEFLNFFGKLFDSVIQKGLAER